MIVIRTDQDAMKEVSEMELARDALRETAAQALGMDTGDGRTWSEVIINTLLSVAVNPDEFTESAAVRAARLLWEIVRDG